MRYNVCLRGFYNSQCVSQRILHNRPKLGAFLPEAAMVILVGMVVGVIVHITVDNHETQGNVASSLLSFSPQVFFIILLPVSIVAET